MDAPNIKLNANRSSLSLENTQDIFIQQSTSPRVSNARKENILSELSVFERSFLSCSDLMPFLELNGETLILLRLVSKIFYEFLSKSPYFVSKVKIIEFFNKHFFIFIHEDEKIRKSIKNDKQIRLERPIHWGWNSHYNYIPDNKLEIIVYINYISSLFDAENFYKYPAAFCDKVVELKFSDIQLNLLPHDHSDHFWFCSHDHFWFIKQILDKPNLFKNLKKLSFKEIEFNGNVILHFLKGVKFSVFTVKNIKWNANARFELKGPLHNLKTLLIGNINGQLLDRPGLYNQFHFKIGDTLNSLSTLKIGNVRNYSFQGSNFEFTSLPNLRVLSIGNISSNTHFKLPECFPEIAILSIGNISSDVTLNLPNLPKLKVLSIGNITTPYFKLPELPDCLRVLVIGNLCTKIPYYDPILPKPCPIKNLYNGKTFFPKLSNLIFFSFGTKSSSIYSKKEERSSGFRDLLVGIKMAQELFYDDDFCLASILISSGRFYRKLGDDDKALEYFKQAYSIYVLKKEESLEQIMEIKKEIELLQPTFFRAQKIEFLNKENDDFIIVDLEYRQPIFNHSLMLNVQMTLESHQNDLAKNSNLVELKHKIQKPVLDNITRIIDKNGWNKNGFLGGEWGIKKYIDKNYLRKKITDLKDIEMAQMLCFEAMNLGIMKSEKKPYEIVESFTKAYPELVKKIALEYPEFFVDGSIVEACAKAMPNQTSKESILKYVQYKK